MAKKYDKHLDDLIKYYYCELGKSPYWMVQNVEEFKGKRPSVIYGVMERLNIKTKKSITLTEKQRKSRRKYNLNDDYFENIDNEHKAYWLGFLYADGYVTNKDKIGISLSKIDYGHLVKFKNDISAEAPIKLYTQTQGYVEGTQYARIILSSKKMKDDLVSNGVLENKTDILEFPKKLDKNLYNHFIRGYFDGDGCITHGGYQKDGTEKFNIKIVGTMEMLNKINEVFGTCVKLIKRHPDRDTNNYTITICGNRQVKRVMDFLYKDATIYLDRKYEKYLNLLKQVI